MIILKDIDGNEIVSGDSLTYLNGVLTLGGQSMGGLNTTNLTFTIDGIDYSFNDGIQFCKDSAWKANDNAFLDLCDQIFSTPGQHAKRSFGEIRAVLEPMLLNPATSAQGQMLFDMLSSYDLEGKYYDPKWWDDCFWHAELV